MKKILSIVLDNQGELSIRRVLALVFSIDLIINIHRCIDIYSAIVYSVIKGNSNTGDISAIISVISSIPQLSMLVGLEAGLIAGLLALTTWQNTNITNGTASN